MEKSAEKQDMKSRIVSAAWELFHDKGYNHTTVDDIIALSGTSKGSFYYYFNTKDELLNTLSDILDEFYNELDSRMNSDMNSFVKLIFLNVEIHAMMEERISMDILASLYSTQLVTEVPSHLLDQNRKYYQLISKIIEEGQQRGQIRTDKSVREIVKYYALCERALVSDWCLSKGSYSLGKYSKEYMPVMLEHFKA